RNYRAYRSQFFEGSKYLHPRYSGRSKIFRPKTRDAVRKKLQSGASALFSTGDVVSVTAQNEADPLQAASAALKQELINMRLSHGSKRNGIKWFLIAMGALQTAQITSLSISKQSWIFREEKVDATANKEQEAEQQDAISSRLRTPPQAPQLPPPAPSPIPLGPGGPGAPAAPGGAVPPGAPGPMPSPMPPSGTAPPQGGPQSGGPPAAPPAPPPPATFPPTSAVQPPPIQKEAPKKTRVIVDRPDIELLAPENVIFDPNCDWTDPAQNSQYVRIARPMSADEAWLFCTKAQGPGKKIPFFNIPLETFKTRAAPQTGPSDSIATRVARQDGKDPIMMTSGAFGRVWLYEWFMKIAGTDYTFWSIA